MRDRLRLIHGDDDRGAVAIIVTIMAILLVGMAAFAVDFGVAYANKTSLQKAADAATLAAAGEIIGSASPNDDCAVIASTYAVGTTALTNLEATADAIAVQNNPNSQRVGRLGVACSPDRLRVDISYSNTGSVPSVFGGVFGVSQLSASRSAVSDIFAAPSGVGLRPYAICLDQANDLKARIGSAQPWEGIEYPTTACPNYAGNWTLLRCPGQWSPSNRELSDDTLYGCPTEVGVIPQWDTSTTPPTHLDIPSPTVIGAITTQCAATASSTLLTPADCMQPTTGNQMSSLGSEWATLLSKPHIALPAFNALWNTWANVTPGVSGCNPTGSNVCYPVAALVSVKVCGFMFGQSNNIASSSNNVDPRGNNPQWGFDNTSSLCNGVRNDMITNPPTGSNNKLWLAMTADGLQTTGTSGPSGQGVGFGYGVYGTRLIQ